MAIHNSFKEPGCDVRVNPCPGTFWLFIDVDFNDILKANVNKSFAAGDDLRVAKVKNEWVMGRAYYRVKRASNASVTYDISVTQNGTTTDLIASAVDGTATTEMVEGYDTQSQSDGYIWLETNGAAITKGKLQICIEVFAHVEDASPVGQSLH